MTHPSLIFLWRAFISAHHQIIRTSELHILTVAQSALFFFLQAFKDPLIDILLDATPDFVFSNKVKLAAD